MHNEHEIQEEMAKTLFQAVNQSSNAIIITDPVGRIEYVNPKFCNITGYSKEEIIGGNPRILKSGELSESVYKKLWETILAGEYWHGEFHNCKKDGSMYWAAATISPVKNELGEVIQLLGIQEDITQRKEMEYQLKGQKLELEETLQELRETQMKLIEQEKMAGIGQLAAGVAHEINNPLGFVISNFSILKKNIQIISQLFDKYQQLSQFVLQGEIGMATELAETTKQQVDKSKLPFILMDAPELLQESADGLERISQIIKVLRSFSRIDQSSEWEEYNLSEGIMDTLAILKNELKHIGEVQLILHEVGMIRGVGGQLNQALLNIIRNAAAATLPLEGSEKGVITIRSHQDQQYVYCSIHDNGIGIASEIMHKIFEPFFTTKPVGEGTGLGLAISYDIIVNKHKGQIKVDSRLGEGTGVTIQLPR